MQKGVLNREHPFFTKESDELTMQNLPERLFFQKKTGHSICMFEKSCIFAASNKKTLGYGVMVTLQILVLSFLVRIQVAQQGKSYRACS